MGWVAGARGGDEGGGGGGGFGFSAPCIASFSWGSRPASKMLVWPNIPFPGIVGIPDVRLNGFGEPALQGVCAVAGVAGALLFELAPSDVAGCAGGAVLWSGTAPTLGVACFGAVVFLSWSGTAVTPGIARFGAAVSLFWSRTAATPGTACADFVGIPFAASVGTARDCI